MDSPDSAFPAALCDALVSRFKIPSRAPGERYYSEWLRVECLVCLSPVARVNDDASQFFLMAVLGDKDAVWDFLNQVKAAFSALGLFLPNMRHAPIRGGQILAAPWLYRGEIRGAVKAAASGVDLQNLSEAGDFPEITPSSRTDLDIDGLRQSLKKFLAPEDTLIGHLRFKLATRRPRKEEFPFGCSVSETVSPNGVVWSVAFSNIETLERAQIAMTGWMRSRRPQHITNIDGDSDDMISEFEEGEFAGMVLWAASDHLEARKEMARLLSHLIVSLDRYSMSVA